MWNGRQHLREGRKSWHLLGRVETQSGLVLHEVCKEPVMGPDRAPEMKRMLSLCCRPQVNPGLMVSVLWLPHREFRMQRSDPAEPGSQCPHLLWS